MPQSSPPVLANSIDAALRARARQVIPGGLGGHLNAANLPEEAAIDRALEAAEEGFAAVARMA